MLSQVEHHSEFKSALTYFIELLSQKNVRANWIGRCVAHCPTWAKQMDRMDTRVNCPKCVLQMWNCISVWDWHTVVFMIISDSASRANLIDWCARSWAGIPRFSFDIHFLKIFLRAHMQRCPALYFQEKSTSVTGAGMWESCGPLYVLGPTVQWANLVSWPDPL